MIEHGHQFINSTSCIFVFNYKETVNYLLVSRKMISNFESDYSKN